MSTGLAATVTAELEAYNEGVRRARAAYYREQPRLWQPRPRAPQPASKAAALPPVKPTRDYNRRRPDGLCVVEGCDRQAYNEYARCNHHRHTRQHYGADTAPIKPPPEHGTPARRRGNKTRPPCDCDVCVEGARSRTRDSVRRWRARQWNGR